MAFEINCNLWLVHETVAYLYKWLSHTVTGCFIAFFLYSRYLFQNRYSGRAFLIKQICLKQIWLSLQMKPVGSCFKRGNICCYWAKTKNKKRVWKVYHIRLTGNVHRFNIGHFRAISIVHMIFPRVYSNTKRMK